MQEFKVGDKVKAWGCNGVVHSVNVAPVCDPELVINVAFNLQPGFRYIRFTADGRQELWHKEPSLLLVERAKTKVKLYPALVKIGGCFMQSHELFANETEGKNEYSLEFIRLLTDDHHAVEVEV